MIRHGATSLLWKCFPEKISGLTGHPVALNLLLHQTLQVSGFSGD